MAVYGPHHVPVRPEDDVQDAGVMAVVWTHTSLAFMILEFYCLLPQEIFIDRNFALT